jgi:hypothetical protein
VEDCRAKCPWSAQVSTRRTPGRGTRAIARAEQRPPRHYSYRLDHDYGFAPHVERGFCTICGCKMTTVERWATTGSWIVGIGGNGTGKPNALIYAMLVEDTPSYGEFKENHRARASYLSGHGILRDAPVLVSSHFYYFGDQAPLLPPTLSHIIHLTQGCKRLTEGDLALLIRTVLKRYRRGVHGACNNKIKQSPRC